MSLAVVGASLKFLKYFLGCWTEIYEENHILLNFFIFLCKKRVSYCCFTFGECLLEGLSSANFSAAPLLRNGFSDCASSSERPRLRFTAAVVFNGGRPADYSA